MTSWVTLSRSSPRFVPGSMGAGEPNAKRSKSWLPCSRMDQQIVSQKSDKDKRKRQHKRRSKRTLTHAVTHIRLIEANPGKLEALDRLVMITEACWTAAYSR